MPKPKMTMEQINKEIEQLKNDPAVKAARQAEREKYKARQKLYTLRWLAKKGNDILSQQNNQSNSLN